MEFSRNKCGIKSTFYFQRMMINAENRCILQLIMYWLFLGESKYLLEHASRVIYDKDGRSEKKHR